MKTQIIGFDILKFILALLVVAIHCWVESYNKGLYSICLLAVPCFFIMSGFLLEKHSGDTTYYKRYVWKISQLYLIWMLVYLPFSIYELFTSGKPYNESLYWYVRNVFISGDFYQGWQLWYLLALIQVSIAIYLLKKCVVGGQVLAMILLCLLGMVSFKNGHDIPVLSDIVVFIKKLYPNGRYVFFTGFCYMTLGTIIAKYDSKLRKGYVCVPLLLVSIYMYMSHYDYSIYFMAFSLVNALSGLTSNNQGICQGSMLIRNLSTLIYLVHMVPLGVATICGFWQDNFVGLYIYAILLSILVSCGILQLSKNRKLFWLKNIW